VHVAATDADGARFAARLCQLGVRPVSRLLGGCRPSPGLLGQIIPPFAACAAQISQRGALGVAHAPSTMES
jgi:hypothetical protein